VAVDAGDDGAQRRQVDVVVGMDLQQVGGAECVGAVRTGSKRRLDDPVRGRRAVPLTSSKDAHRDRYDNPD
jgi:hypothetical protein